MYAKILVFLFPVVIALIVYEAYRDITKKHLSTNVYIAIIALLKIILFGIPCYFIYYNISDKWILLNVNIHPSLLTVFFCGLLFLDKFIKSERFKKKK